MNTTIEKQPENVVKVDIEIPAKDAVNYYNDAAKRLAQYVNIPGFRKGKAPRNIVEQNIGEERIKHEALENALPRIFSQVIKENDLILDLFAGSCITSLCAKELNRNFIACEKNKNFINSNLEVVI